MKYTTESWIKKAKEIHGDAYDYSLVKYTNQRGKVKILCKTCGKLFEQSAGNHLQRHGCPHCKTHGFKDYKEGVLYILLDNLKNHLL